MTKPSIKMRHLPPPTDHQMRHQRNPRHARRRPDRWREPALLAAMKLARGSPQDIEDINWWVTEHVNWWVQEPALDLDKIRAAIDTLPKPAKREAATRNLVHITPRRRPDQVASARPAHELTQTSRT